VAEALVERLARGRRNSGFPKRTDCVRVRFVKQLTRSADVRATTAPDAQGTDQGCAMGTPGSALETRGDHRGLPGRDERLQERCCDHEVRGAGRNEEDSVVKQYKPLQLRSLEGRQVGVALRDGSRIEDAQLVSSGRGNVRTLWVFTKGFDAFVPLSDVVDVWEAEAA
jgi:hypothetical protein